MLRYVDIYFTCSYDISIGSHASSLVKSRPAIDFCPASLSFVVTKAIVTKIRSVSFKPLILFPVLCVSQWLTSMYLHVESYRILKLPF